jgi:hypothetical protein
MRKRVPTDEWHMGEGDADWERLPDPPAQERLPDAARRPRLQRYLWRVAALLLLLASADGGRGRTDQAALSHPATDVPVPSRDPSAARHATLQTATAWQRPFVQEDSGLRAAIQTHAPTAQVDGALSTVDVQGDQAVVSLVTIPKNGVPAYRQTRFYRRTATGWLPMAPDVALWGPARSLETPYFVYHFRQNDTQAVITVASQVDDLYTSLRRNLGLSLTPGAQKLIIDVSVTQSPGVAAFSQRTYERFIVPSPAVYWAPVELSDADLLAQSIALLLFDHLLAQASELYQIGRSWQPMLNGLYLWHVWDTGLPLSAWQEAVVKWLYLDLASVSVEPRGLLPDQYEALCAAHALWLMGPVYVGIPLLCNELDQKDQHLSWGELWPPLARLDRLAVPDPQPWLRDPDRLEPHPGVPVVLATLVEYAVATYGRERLPALVAGLGQYESWDTLVPAVFGVSAAEFEAGWQAYLAAHYSTLSSS